MFQLFKVQTDYGWIIENKSEQILLGFNEVNFDIIAIDPSTSTKYFETIIYFDKKQDIYLREYPKIQTLLAELGGILNFFIVVFKTLSNIYASFHLRLKLIKALDHKNSGFEEKTLKDLKILYNGTLSS